MAKELIRREVFQKQCKSCIYGSLHHVVCRRPPFCKETSCSGYIKRIRSQPLKDVKSELYDVHKKRKGDK